MLRVRTSTALLSVGLFLLLFTSATISGALTSVQADRSVSGTLTCGSIPIPLTTGLSGSQGTVMINSSQTTSYATITNNTGSSMTLNITITPQIIGKNGKKWDMHFKIKNKDFHFRYNAYTAVTYTSMVLTSDTTWKIYAYYNTSKSHDGTEIHFAYSITITSPSPARTLTDSETTPLYIQIIC
jgi:hypothetical protein